MEVVLFVQLDVVARTHGYVHLDFLARPVDVFRHPRDFEDGLLVPAGSDYVGMRLLLNSFDCSSFRSNHKPNYTVRHPDLDCRLPRQVGGTWQASQGRTVFVARRSDHGEVLSSRENFPFGHGYILFPSSDDKDGFFSTNGGLNVSIRLGPQRFDFATCLKETHASLATRLSLESHKKAIYFELLESFKKPSGETRSSRFFFFLCEPHQ